MGVLCHDVVENILERVPVKSLLRFKSVSKRWKSTIESKNFQERQMNHRQQSQGPDVLFLTNPFQDSDYDYYDDEDDATEYVPSSLSFSVNDNDNGGDDDDIKIKTSSPFITVKFPFQKRFSNFSCSASCDGLVCFYNDYQNIVINPTTRWHRYFPLSSLQQHRSQSVRNRFGILTFGFGKDKFNGAYKSVWLYDKTGELDAWSYVTTCEIFDFSLNAWRNVTLASPYEISTYIETVSIDGSLYWLTKRELGIEVLSFDLHTETIQVVAETPFDKADIHHYGMCNLNNHLCVSETNYPNQVIWLFDSVNKKWNHIHSIDLEMTYSWFRKSTENIELIGDYSINPLQPLAILEEKNAKMKVLYSFFIRNEPSHLLIYDGESYELAFSFNYAVMSVNYLQSLISIS